MKTTSVSFELRRSLARVFALMVLAAAAILGAWLAGETVSRSLAPGGNPAWLMWPFALGAPVLWCGTAWVMWLAEYFKNPPGERWTSTARWTLVVAITGSLVVVASTIPFIRAVV